MPRRSHSLIYRLFGDMFVGAFHYASREALHKLHVVRGHDHGCTLVGYVAQAPHNLFAGFGVQIAGGFVGKHKLGLVEKGASYHYALLLAARQLMGHLI